MAFSVIDKGSKYFTAKTYTGTGATQSISGLEFSPDFVWIKNRSGANSHGLVSSLVNTRYALDTSATSGEVDFSTSGVTSLNSDGFTVVSHPVFNGSGNNYVSWCWDANGSGVSNTAGTISSTVSANTTSGFSIVSYTGNGNTAASVGHGLGVTPAMMIIKKRSATHEWTIWHKSLSSSTQSYLQFDTLAAQTSANTWGNTAPTSSLFYVGSASVTNGSSATFIAYCFTEVKGFSKAFSYTGNGSTDGTFVYCGFKPAFVLAKRSTTAGEDWTIYDNKRNDYNPVLKVLYPDSSGAEASAPNTYDFLSNGFKLRSSDGRENLSGATFIGIAFAENPFVSSKGIPCTAR